MNDSHSRPDGAASGGDEPQWIEPSAAPAPPPPPPAAPIAGAPTAFGDPNDFGMRVLLPVGRSPWAIVSGYLGLFSVLLVPAPLALITGIIAVWHIMSRDRVHGLGRAIFGIIMGLLGTVILLIAVIGAMTS